MMQPVAVLLALVACFASYVSATAITYKLDASEKACFYAWVSTPPQKVSFYFA
ncbi:hypothetical protein KEM52_006675, partial [Ascosphaera acerosa]